MWRCSRWRRLALLAVIISALFSGCAAHWGGNGSNGDTITFGATISITGTLAEEGQYTRDGYLMAINTINREGGIKIGGSVYHLALRYYDDESRPDLALQLYQQLITQDKVDFLLGPYSSELTEAVAPLAEKYHLPLVEGNGAAESIFNHGYRYVFGVQSPAKDYLTGIIAVVLAKDPGASTLAILGAEEPFSQEVKAGAIEYAQSKGMRVVYQGDYPTYTLDLSTQLQAIKAVHPDVLLGAGHVQDTLLIAKQAQDLCVSPKAMGFSVGPASLIFRPYLQSKADYIFGASQWTSALQYVGTDPWKTPQAYTAAFRSQFPRYTEIPYQAAESSASVIAFQSALKHAGSLDSAAVRTALAHLDIMTFYGPIKFDQRGLNIYKPMAVEQLQPDGGQYTVYPFDVAERPALYPMPPCGQPH
jgi:branched-chain amino acid transport system substrate-binding protein